jgi:DNA-directed RNA polymerase specialized sigma24 family protein
MDASKSVSLWIQQLQTGDEIAAECIWARYARRLLGLARRRLLGARRGADEEDVVQDAFLSLCRGAVAGRFAALDDRDSLWRLLQVIVQRKAADQQNHDRRQKRGGGRVRGDSAICGDDGLRAAGRRDPAGEGTNPAREAEVAEMYSRLLESLPGEGLRGIAALKIDGYTNDEIAAQLGCARCTVVRKLELIRDIWNRRLES